MLAAATLVSLGAQVRSTRERLGLTLDDVAGRTGISKAHLSRIESCERQPAIATLLTLAEALGTRVGTLLGEDHDDGIVSVHQFDAGARHINGLVATAISGYRGSTDLEALHLRIEPDRPTPEFAVHPGEEWLHVLRGTLRLECAGEVHVVPATTSVHFDAKHPHRLSALDGGIDVLLVASSPPRRGVTDLHS